MSYFILSSLTNFNDWESIKRISERCMRKIFLTIRSVFLYHPTLFHFHILIFFYFDHIEFCVLSISVGSLDPSRYLSSITITYTIDYFLIDCVLFSIFAYSHHIRKNTFLRISIF